MSLLIITPRRHADDRGWFSESWNRAALAQHGIVSDFCQDNHSFSAAAGTLRGLHFQRPPCAQAKLVRCIRGRIYDVAVDLRRASPTFGQWRCVELDAAHGRQLFVPAGYGHGFVTLEPDCELLYKVDAPYDAAADAGIAWNDPALAIDWPAIVSEAAPPILSAKDAALPGLSALDCDFAYDGTPIDLVEVRL